MKQHLVVKIFFIALTFQFVPGNWKKLPVQLFFVIKITFRTIFHIWVMLLALDRIKTRIQFFRDRIRSKWTGSANNTDYVIIMCRSQDEEAKLADLFTPGFCLQLGEAFLQRLKIDHPDLVIGPRYACFSK
jgi:hypothetical protein